MLEHKVEVHAVEQGKAFKVNLALAVGKRTIRETNIETFEKAEQAFQYEDNLRAMMNAYRSLKLKGR